jgi:hypothetical protein
MGLYKVEPSPLQILGFWFQSFLGVFFSSIAHGFSGSAQADDYRGWHCSKV